MQPAPPDPSQPALRARVRAELGPLLRLAGPVAVAQVGLLTMGLVDTWVVGHLGPVELGAVALSDSLFFTLIVVAMGIVGALDPMVSQAAGAQDPARCSASWRAGLRLSILLTVPLAALVLGLAPLLESVGGQDPDVVRAAADYLVPSCLGILPMLLFVANRSLLNGLGSTRPPMVVAILANLLNLWLDWGLVFGMWGLPALGVAGAALATVACRWFMFGGLLWWIRRNSRYAAYSAPAPVPGALLLRAVRLGLPIGLAHGAEVGAFSLCALFMGWLGVVPLASHMIALRMASTSFMLAVALGVATSVRVGNALGAGRPEDAQRSAWVGLGAGAVTMTLSALLFVLFRGRIVAAFTDDAAVIALGADLLVVAAAFQLVDGAQAIASGALRGAGETLRPLLAQLVAHWAVAMPLGAYLAFGRGLGPEAGARAIWWALALGLAIAAALLIWRLPVIRTTRALDDPPSPRPAPEPPPQLEAGVESGVA